MKRMLIIGSIAALATVGFAGTANAAEAPNANANANACFGQIHKYINANGYGPYAGVGEVVQAVGGQAKNETARGLAAGGFCE